MKHSEKEQIPALPIPLGRLRENGLSPSTIRQHRRNGWLPTINVSGRQFVAPDTLREYLRRMSAGEFSKAPHGAAKLASDARRARLAHGQGSTVTTSTSN